MGRARKFSLHLGFNYPRTNSALHGCWNDAFMMRKLAINMGYKPRVLLDNRRRSRARIIREIRALIRKPNGSQLFLTYSGHGASVAAGADKYEKDRKNEALVMPDLSLLQDGQFFNLIRQLPSRSRLTIVLDCCHSGTGCDFPLVLQASRNQWALDRPDTVLNRKRPIIMLAGCKDAQYSYERATQNKVRGALTVAFYQTMIRAIHRNRRRRRGRRNIAQIGCRGLLNQVKKRINDRHQIPVVSCTKRIPVNFSAF